MNSAKRLFDLFSAAKANRSQEASFKNWIQVFNLEGEPAEQYEDIGASCMAAVRDELDVLAESLLDQGVPDELFRWGTDELRGIVSPTQFSNGWNHLVDRIGREHLNMLRWADWVLGGDEQEVDAAELAKLIAELDELIAQLEASSLRRFTKDLMLRHLNSVRKSLRTYRARGIEPVNAALNETLGAMSVRTAHVKEDLSQSDPEATGIFSKAANMINKVVKVAENAQKVQKGIDAGIQIAHQVQQIWNAFPEIGN